ncbi:MAG: hypothetical protein JSV65_05195 [Armatimonadota bacterium]|nr:MAG: hypothetical protein JSV65_05195 [Armatimonadota bacterium]
MEYGLFLFLGLVCACFCAAGGLSEIDRWGLHWKAVNYERAMQARHLRDGGLAIGGVDFPFPKGHEREDDENCAYLTGAYLAAVCFRYAVTGEPEALEQAKRSAASLRKLVDVTGSPGYLARWWRPATADAPTPTGWLAKCWQRNGAYEWLGNPSTDQYTGVFFGWSVYYDLAADAAERKLTAKYVGDMAGRILDADMKILDPEGKPTTWYDMAPETLQQPVYAPVALHLLKVAYQVTGEQRFEDKYRELALQHDYLARSCKRSDDPEWNRSDDVMSFESFYTTITQEKDAEIRQGLVKALQVNWDDVRADGRWLFGIFYDALCPGRGQSKIALQELVDYPSHKITVKDREQTEEPIPAWQRSYGWFEFMCDTRMRLVGSEQAGVDYLLAYWMARHHGLV